MCPVYGELTLLEKFYLRFFFWKHIKSLLVLKVLKMYVGKCIIEGDTNAFVIHFFRCISYLSNQPKIILWKFKIEKISLFFKFWLRAKFPLIYIRCILYLIHLTFFLLYFKWCVLITHVLPLIIPPANEVAGVYSDPYVRPFVRSVPTNL